MNYLNLTPKQVDRINRDHLHAIDKLYRMFAGVSSTLTGVSHGTGYLHVTIHRHWERSAADTAMQFIKSWTQQNSVLERLDGWEVTIINKHSQAGTNKIHYRVP